MKVTEKSSLPADMINSLNTYHDLFAPSPDSVFFMDSTGIIFDINQSSADLLGYSQNELCGLRITDLLPKEDLDEDVSQISSLIINQVIVKEKRLRRKDGKVIQVEIHAQKLHGDIILCIVRDLTSQKEEQVIFHQMEDRYRLIVETATEGICTMDERNLITYVNTRMADMVGYSEDEIVGKTMEPFLYEEDIPHYWELMSLRQKGNAETVERRLRRIDGSTLWVNVSPKPVMDGEGIYRGQFAMFTDITMEKRNGDIQKARLRILQFMDDHSLDELLQETLDNLGELTDSPIGFFHFLAPDQATFTRRAWSSKALRYTENYRGDNRHQPFDQMGIWKDCINDRKAMIINDLNSLAHMNNMPKDHPEITRFLLLPIIRGDTVVALLGIGDKSSPYNEGDVSLVTSFADLVWDIAERKLAEEELKQNSIQYQAIISTSLDGFSMCSSSGKILEANDAYCRMLGYNRDEILGLSIPDIEANEKPEETASHIRAMTENGSERFETRHKCKDGRIIDVEVNTTYIPDRGIFMTFTRDITESKRVEEALRENQELLTLFIHHSPIYTFIKSVTPTESRVIQASNNYYQMIGIPNEEMIGKTMAELFPPEFAEKITADDWSVVTKGEVLELNEELNGRSYITIKFPIQQRGITLLAGYTIDITENKQAEEGLTREKQRLANIIKGTDVGTWEWNVQTGEDIYNDRWAEMIGYSLEELSPTTFVTWSNLVHPEDFKRSRELEEKHFRGESDFYECEVRLRHKNGSWIWVLARGKVIAWTDDGKPLLMYGTHQDITERKQVEEESLKREWLLEESQNIAHLGSYIYDADTQRTYWTKETYRIFALDENSPALRGVDFEKFIHPEDLEIEKKIFNESIEKGIRFDWTYRIITNDGEIRFIHSIGNPEYENGKLKRFTGTLQDITESKVLENNLQASLAEKEVLLREVHHRVKNNLAAILGLMDMERQSTTDETAENLLVELSNRIKSMSTVHEKLYRAESLSKIDFQDYLKSFTSHLRTSFRTKVDIINTINADGIELSLDLAVPCGLIVNELVTNSIKYAFPGGKPGAQHQKDCKIDITMKEESGSYTLMVSDNGIGIPAGLDWRETRTMGLRLVRMLGEHQLGGRVDLDIVNGTHFKIQFDTNSRE